MLNKQPNSIVTLAAVLLALVGVHQPAKAFLLAQADTTPTTFTAPDKLPAQAKLEMATSNSTSSINQSLKEGFIGKYPQAKVNIKTQSSADALQELSAGKVDLVGIGRNLTNTEKQKGFVAVPISREKIAIVISKDNPYEGNLTISQFAQIFRGEITDWSEIGGNPGQINLVDSPDTNDTRQAFPSYPVFQESEFVTAPNAVKLNQDTTDEMITQLGANGIGYAVANDVINRDDVKVVTMHQTQPDDARYPFSQPFNLVYQGTPSDATKAFLGFATTQGREQVVANRIGSISSAAVAIAPKLGNQANNLPKTTVDGNSQTVSPNGGAETNSGVASTGVNEGTKSGAAGTNVDGNAIAQADGNLENSGEVNPKVEGNGEANPNVEGSGEASPNIEDSGEVNPAIKGSGEVNPDIEGSGEVNPAIKGSGEVNPNIESSGEPNTAIDSQDPEAVATAKKGKWWWWLPLILGIPILAAIAIFGFGGKKRGDNEPAVGEPPDIEPSGGRGIPGEPLPGSDLSAVGANAATNLGDVTTNTGATTSKLGGAARATGGAAIAGGTAAAANFVRGKRATENEIERIDIELDDTNSNIENPVIEEIPSNPVNEFTGQETKLQTTDQSTKLQTTDQSTKLQPDITEGINENTSGLLDGISDTGSAAVIGGAGASGWFGDRNLDENSEDLSNENPTYTDVEYVSEQPTRLQTTNLDSDFEGIITDESAVESNLTVEPPVAQEFSGDFVLDEETPKANTEIETANLDSNISGEWGDERTNLSGFNSESIGSVETPDVDLDTEIEDGTASDNTSGFLDGFSDMGGAAAGGAAVIGGAAASGWLDNRDRPQTAETDADTEIEVVDLDRDISTEWGDERTNLSGFDSESIDNIETPDTDADTEIEDGIVSDNTSGFLEPISDTQETAASGWLDNRDRFETTEFENVNLESDISVDLTDSSFADNISNDVASRSENVDLSLEEITFDDVDNSTNASLEEITFDSTENLNDINLDEITFDDVDNSTNASLEEITFDSTENLSDINLDEITFDDVDNPTNASLEEITFDSTENLSDINLDEITFDDVDNSTNATNINVDNIIFNDKKVNSTDNLINSLDDSSNDPEISLDDLDFDQSNDDFTSNLPSSNTAKVTDLSDAQSNDMNNISTWLDSLETPSQSSEDITGWLDKLNIQDHDSQNNPSNQRELELKDETEDISFQFLEDLLERDTNNNKDNQQ